MVADIRYELALQGWPLYILFFDNLRLYTFHIPHDKTYFGKI